MGANTEKGCNAAIVLKYGTADQATVKGLNSLTLPSLTRSIITSEEFGVDFASSDAGGGKYGDIQYGGNAITGDTKGQDQLKAYLVANTKFTDARVYINTVTGHFLAPDTAQDTEAGFQVTENTPGSVGVNDTFKFTGKWCCNGRYAIFTVHRPDVDTPKIAFVASATPTTTGATITDSTSAFVTDGFKAGQTLIIEGSTTNDGVYLIKTVVDGTITLDILGAKSQLTAEPALATTILHGGTL